MTVRNQRKRFLAAAHYLRTTKKLTRAQRLYFALAFERIGHGMSADAALGLKYTAGHSEAKEIAREDLAFIFHWVTCALEPDIEGNPGLTISQALDAVYEIARDGKWTSPLSGRTHSYKDTKGQIRSPFRPYSRETLSKAWYSANNADLKRLYCGPLDTDSPYDFVRSPPQKSS